MQNPPRVPAGPPADYFLSPPAQHPTPDAQGYAMPQPPAYPQQPAYQQAPGYAQPAWQQAGPAQPAAGAGWSIFAQFSGVAGWACVIGLVTVVVPLFFGRVFFFLPIIGVIYGVRAIARGAVVGGAIGAVLSAIGGILTIVGLTVH